VAATAVCLACMAGNAGAMEFGARAGAAWTRIDVGTWQWSDWSRGVNAAGVVAWDLSRRVSLVSGVEYTRFEGRYVDMSSHPDGSLAAVDESTYAADFLQFPLHVRLRSGSPARANVTLFGGPVLTTAISSEWTFTGSDPDEWWDGATLGFSLGVGLDLPVRSLPVSLEALYFRSGIPEGSSYAYTDGGAVNSLNARCGVRF